MTYEHFLQGIKWTEAQWRRLSAGKTLPPAFHYESLRGRGTNYWLSLHQMTTTQLSRDIIAGFLNTAEWNCRLPGPRKPAKHGPMVANLKKAINHVAPYYQALTRFELVNSNFLGATSLMAQSVPISHIITRTYEEYCAIKPKFGRVPASKLMHMALPDLLIMWDNAIIEGYRVPSCRSRLSNELNASYLAFLVLMQENANHIKHTSPAGLSMHWPNFVASLRAQCGYHNLVTMPRLLDVANYAVGHPEMGAPPIKCRECCERANSRLPQIEASIKQQIGKQLSLGRFIC